MNVMSSLADEEIVARIRAGETALYEVLMRRYNQRLYRVARSIVRDAAEAEDVMQDAYVRAYEHLASFAGDAKFATWLTKIAVYEALRRVRRRARIDPLMSTATTLPSPERQTYDHELRTVLERAIDHLPEGYRSVFVLRVVEELDVAETAAILEVGPETVKTRLHRARAMLRRDLHRRAGIAAAQAFAFHATRCDRVAAEVLRRLKLPPASTPANDPASERTTR
jgi:RNA polymerase sigma-70 factor (ECF subfamily)